MWEDCKSLVDLKIFRYMESFDETRGEISPWLYRLVASCCEDTKKQGGYNKPARPKPSGKTMLSLDDETVLDLLNVIKQPESEDHLERSEMSNCLWNCIGAAMEEMDIDQRHKAAFEMFYKYEFKLREIAEHYHLSETTVNNWPGATLKRITPYIKNCLNEKLGCR